jgi:hypothetical protein
MLQSNITILKASFGDKHPFSPNFPHKALFSAKQCSSKGNVWRQTMHSAEMDIWRQTMFVAKHFDKHFCLSLGNTGLLTYKNRSGNRRFRQ